MSGGDFNLFLLKRVIISTRTHFNGYFVVYFLVVKMSENFIISVDDI